MGISSHTSAYNSEIRECINRVKQLRGTNSEEIISLCDKLYEIGERTNDNALKGFSFFSKGELYYIRNDVSNALKCFIGSLQPWISAGEWGYVAMVNNFLGIVSLNRGNVPYALKHYDEGIEVCQRHSLPNIERRLQMNIGALYLSIEEYAKAKKRIEIAYDYLKKNTDQEDYISDMAVACLGLAKANLKLKEINKAMQYLEQLQYECMPYLSPIEKMVVYCFKARVYNDLDQPERRDKYIDRINDMISKNFLVLDVFEEFHDYLEMLLEIERYDDFFNVYSVLDEVIKGTQVKNLEIKLLTLKIKYYHKTHQFEEYKKSAVLFYELSVFMEHENKAMVSQLLAFRDDKLDIIEQKNSLQKKSETDALTGLYNRFKLNEYMNQTFERAINNNTPFAIEILDIDYFKQYNDNYGHQAGDVCIKTIADAILTMKGNSNIFCCRYGGDEFVLIYDNMSMEEVSECTALLKSIITRKAVTHKFSKAAEIVSITQGACWGRPKKGQTAAEYLKCADALLYAVKSESRNSFRVDTFESINLK